MIIFLPQVFSLQMARPLKSTTHGNVGTTVIFPVARRHRQLTGNVLYCLLTGSEGWSYKPGVITHAAARTRDALIASPTPNTLRHHASQRNCSKKPSPQGSHIYRTGITDIPQHAEKCIAYSVRHKGWTLSRIDWIAWYGKAAYRRTVYH